MKKNQGFIGASITHMVCK